MADEYMRKTTAFLNTDMLPIPIYTSGGETVLRSSERETEGLERVCGFFLDEFAPPFEVKLLSRGVPAGNEQRREETLWEAITHSTRTIQKDRSDGDMRGGRGGKGGNDPRSVVGCVG